VRSGVFQLLRRTTALGGDRGAGVFLERLCPADVGVRRSAHLEPRARRWQRWLIAAVHSYHVARKRYLQHPLCCRHPSITPSRSAHCLPSPYSTYVTKGNTRARAVVTQFLVTGSFAYSTDTLYWATLFAEKRSKYIGLFVCLFQRSIGNRKLKGLQEL